MNEDILLQISHLKKQYDENVIIKDLSLNIKDKEFLCVLGASGCGKTTLLRCIAGFENYSGDIVVAGKVCRKPGPDRIMVFQDFNQLFPWKTIEKNIQYPLKKNGIKDKEELKAITEDVLKKVRLENVSNKYPHQLSGGMKQRVAIAKALALKPSIILMDEPFAALDAMTRRQLQNELVQITDNQCTVIFVTHNIQEALVLGTRYIVLGKGGKIELDEKNTLEKPITPASAEYGKAWKQVNDALYA